MTSPKLPGKEFLLIEWFVKGEQCAVYRLSEHERKQLLGSFASREQLEKGKTFPLTLTDGSTVRVQLQDGEPHVLKDDSPLSLTPMSDNLVLEFSGKLEKRRLSSLATIVIGIVGVVFIIAGVLSYLFAAVSGNTGGGIFGLDPTGVFLVNIGLGLAFFCLALLALRRPFFFTMLAFLSYLLVSVISIIYAGISTVQMLAAEAGATSGPNAAAPVWGLIATIVVRFAILATLWGVAMLFSKAQIAQAEAETLRSIHDLRSRVLCYQVEEG
jgi:MFS family permease